MILENLFNLLNEQKSFPPFQLHRGEIFSAIEDSEGGIGIAASPDFPDDSAEAGDYLNRVIMQCRINARMNKLRPDLTDESFIASAVLSANDKIVMAGFIRPIYDQLIDTGLFCNVFDLKKEASELMPLDEMDDYLRQIALAIMGRMQENDGIMTRTFMRKCYNYDYLYRQYYDNAGTPESSCRRKN